MKKVEAFLLVGLIASMLIGCGAKNDDAVIGISVEKLEDVQPVEAASVEETEEEADEDAPPKEGMVRSYFTNEWVDEAINENRPLAVMYPINKEAQPQYGLSNVAVFYEIMEEGSMSRQMGILEDWEDLEQIGNIRSIRDYFIYAALEYDPVIVHFGGPELYVKSVLTRDDVDNVNGVGGVMGPDYGAFFRIPKGSASEHTAFTDGEHISKAIDKAKFSREHRDKFEGESHFKFTSAVKPNMLEDYSDAVEATEIDMKGCFPVTKSALKYDEDKGVYLKSLYGSAQKDAITGEQLAFSNIIIQRTYHEVRDDNGYLAYQMHDTTQDGYFITKGKMIHITWKKTDDYSPTTYYDDNGDEITLNTGKTMIFVVQEKGGSFSKFTVNGETYAD
ncbi:DUF3048 domain-containing protein [Butyrivibrio sp. XB500-5]|uniref:DUF3048 domain-containing protein n=1 Tax=Butyrivibrio sp. XB500-5 TaxID=2364880 RepID=UPI000EAA99FA|nr:DUF3048 domain-containing protein [Butyrivibrio sp. XB500-5]RKM60217.1 DUF3048 domain-containing protein [Butyrivibrio sp. XB500-5]